MKVQIMLAMEPPKPSKEMVEAKGPSIEEEVRQAIEMIDSGHDSYVEWKLLNKLAKELRNRKDARSKNLMEMIDPVLSKYGMHGVSEESD
jgi:Ca2+-binding EF-hand superfamily protein